MSKLGNEIDCKFILESRESKKFLKALSSTQIRPKSRRVVSIATLEKCLFCSTASKNALKPRSEQRKVCDRWQILDLVSVESKPPSACPYARFSTQFKASILLRNPAVTSTETSNSSRWARSIEELRKWKLIEMKERIIFTLDNHVLN